MGTPQKKQIQTATAPPAIGPYSQAIAFGDMLFTSGQIALIPETGSLVEGGIEPEIEQVLRNLKAVLAAADLGMEDVLKTTIFLTNMNDFAIVNDAYERALGGGSVPPARSTVQVAALPRGARVEIEAIAMMTTK